MPKSLIYPNNYLWKIHRQTIQMDTIDTKTIEKKLMEALKKHIERSKTTKIVQKYQK